MRPREASWNTIVMTQRASKEEACLARQMVAVGWSLSCPILASTIMWSKNMLHTKAIQVQIINISSSSSRTSIT
jgi:hypothetical protein